MFEPRSVEVHGNVAPGFELVRKEFQKNFELGEELSAQLCIVYKGEIVSIVEFSTLLQGVP